MVVEMSMPVQWGIYYRLKRVVFARRYFSTDACMSECRGFYQGNHCHTEFPAYVLEKGFDIGGLELLVYCDKEAVCQGLNTGRSRRRNLQKGLREVCFFAAVSGK
ncbi:hypothetical protein MAR_013956 [Mya arenaria]|uniref:Uncharacterized protein n=1 Tax=Mya arenaria TaxID=6604 RepID=A0ABY7G1D3_MYAAR|nr:hypothetical protein MAR_013956 [Mya arenaria]